MLLEVGRCDDVQRRSRAVDEETWNVTAVDRLQQEPDSRGLQFARRIAEVADQRGPRRVGGNALRQDACKAVDLRTVERRGIVDRPFDARAKLGGPVGVAGNSALAGRPVAGGQIVQRERKPVARDAVHELNLLELVREQELDRVEPRLCSHVEAAEERQFGEHHGQVRSKLRHGSSFFPAGRPGREPENIGCRSALLRESVHQLGRRLDSSHVLGFADRQRWIETEDFLELVDAVDLCAH